MKTKWCIEYSSVDIIRQLKHVRQKYFEVEVILEMIQLENTTLFLPRYSIQYYYEKTNKEN